MPVYILKTMSQDLARARGEEPGVLRIETEETVSEEKRRDYESSEAESELESAPEQKSGELSEPSAKTKGEPKENLQKGGLIEEKKETQQKIQSSSKPGGFFQEKLSDLPRIPLLHDRRVLMVLVVFVLLFGFGAVSYFGGGVGGAYVERIRGLLGVEQKEDLSVDLKIPAGGEKWEKDKEYRVLWGFEGDGQKEINIVYLKSGVKVGTIAGNISLKALKQSWRVPQNLDPSDEYKIRINAVNPKEGSSPLLAESSSFSIVSTSSEPDLPGGAATTSTTTTATTTDATTTDATTTVSDYETSPNIIEFDHEQTLVLREEKSPKSRLESLIEVREGRGLEGLQRLKFILPEFEREMKPQRLLEELQLSLSEEIWADLGLDYNLFLYRQSKLFEREDKKERTRFGIILETFAPKSTFEKMVAAEDKIDEFVQSGDYLFDTGDPAFDSFHTNTEDYPHLFVRYQNYLKPDLSFDYGVVKTKNSGAYLLIANSRIGMEKMVSRFQSSYKLEKFKPELSAVGE